ncbi:IS1 family transposase [Flavobacterium sp. KACC 22761]|uniref:IS1 family transposase n=1 Tax=Flavobacterium sp. KACC 22761 TaxID=3092665 RepID=UPI002A755427|nr:IS1 family transposase [Flavobacterium sp. KACC 22761]WPO78015.1 IS1 family transposase [Flavobacterium sp. KACC 22761]
MKKKCENCGEKCNKDGFQSNGVQRYKCVYCQKKQQANYTYNAYKNNINEKIIILTKEGLGIRSTARVLNISTTTVLKKICLIAENIPRPVIKIGKTYEVDEMRSYLKKKSNLIWIVYALERESGKVVSFNVGNRTNKTLEIVLTTLKLSNPKAIYTDNLKNYKYLIPSEIHKTVKFGTNNIERKNLAIRTHLKRLNRRTICYSKSKKVLLSILKIYFWH